MRKRLIAVTAAVLLAAACGADAAAAPAHPAGPPTTDAQYDMVIYHGNNGGTAFYEVHVRLSDGRTVACVVATGTALSCDWAAK